MQAVQICNSDPFTINSVFFISFVYITVSLIFIFLIIRTLDYLDYFTQVPTSPDNQGSTVLYVCIYPCIGMFAGCAVIQLLLSWG